jgi:protein phosphatase
MDLSSVLEISSKSDVGRVRSHNEDSIAFDAETGIAVLADGMGGYNAGEVASGIAVALITAGLKGELARAGRLDVKAREALLKEQVLAANNAIMHAAQKRPECEGMGTTVVAALFREGQVSVAHLGDSRLYRLREGKLDVLTRDHSLLQEQLDQGMLTPEEAKTSSHRNIVTRALGVERDAIAEVGTFDALSGDIYLLCSDGLNDMLEDEEIGLTVRTLGENVKLAADQLVELANENGGRDNVSVILVKVKAGFETRQGLLAKLFRK